VTLEKPLDTTVTLETAANSTVTLEKPANTTITVEKAAPGAAANTTTSQLDNTGTQVPTQPARREEIEFYSKILDN